MTSPAPSAGGEDGHPAAPVPGATTAAAPVHGAHPGVRAIAVAEGLKGVLALAGAGGLEFVGSATLLRGITAVAERFRWDPGQGTTGWLLQRIDAGTVHVAAIAIAVYGAMRLVEAWGLWRARAWASWFGCISAAIYIPFELYALARDPGWLTLGVLAVNLLIVWVLAHDLVRRRR